MTSQPDCSWGSVIPGIPTFVRTQGPTQEYMEAPFDYNDPAQRRDGQSHLEPCLCLTLWTLMRSHEDLYWSWMSVNQNIRPSETCRFWIQLLFLQKSLKFKLVYCQAFSIDVTYTQHCTMGLSNNWIVSMALKIFRLTKIINRPRFGSIWPEPYKYAIGQVKNCPRQRFRVNFPHQIFVKHVELMDKNHDWHN